MRRSVPNLISASRLVLVVPLAMMIWAGRHSPPWRWAVIVMFFWIALSDWLDGLLARRFAAQSALGRVLDPAADKIVALVCFVVLAWAGRQDSYYPLPLWLVGVVVGKDVWQVTGYLVIRLIGVEIAVRPSLWGKASTGLQLLLVGAILVRPESSWRWFGHVPDVLIWPAAAMTAFAAASYTWTAIQRLATVQLVAVERSGA